MKCNVSVASFILCTSCATSAWENALTNIFWFVEVSPLAYGGVGLACNVGVTVTVTNAVGVKGGVDACL